MSGVEQLELVMRTPAMDDALRKAAINAVTYRAAMRWAASHEQEGAALRIAAMVPLSHHRGERRAEILERLRQAHSAGQLDDAAAGHAWAAVTHAAFEQSDWQAALQASARAVEHFQAAGLPRLTAWAQYFYVASAWGAGQLEEFNRLIGEAIGSFRREHDDMGLGYSLWLASLRSVDLDTAKDMAAEADELLRRVEVPMGVAHNVEGRGIIAFERGELDEAANFLTEAIQTFASYGNVGCTAHALEASAVVIGTASHNGGSLALELLAAATQFRRQSGQGRRPWEIRARLGDLQDRIVTPNATAAHPPESRYTLSVASTLAAQALQSLATPHAS
jgi:tetratricopeptide (TPR) repeat protein